MDKMPPYIIEAKRSDELPSFIKKQGNTLIYEIYESDGEYLKKIKEFMALYGITDIKMRMLRIPELKKIKEFSERLYPNRHSSRAKKYIGNAVEVNMARVLCEALVSNLI